MRTLCRIVVLVTIASAVGASAQAVPSATELSAKVQARYATIRDFTADFTLTQTSALLPRPVVERGELKVKKPGRLKWTYTSAEKKVFVSDGSQFYSYYPQDRFVGISRLPVGEDAPMALMFLAGRANLTRDFTPTLAPEQPAGEWRILLTPKSSHGDFKTLTLEVDRVSLALRGFTVVEEQGSVSAFRFAKLQENRGLADNDFVFTMPKGVEVRRQ
jgi:outer membrane lipoprotein carrier protein